MSARVHCDASACTKTRPAGRETSIWIHVEDYGPTEMSMGFVLSERELDFCSRACLVAFMSEKRS